MVAEAKVWVVAKGRGVLLLLFYYVYSVYSSSNSYSTFNRLRALLVEGWVWEVAAAPCVVPATWWRRLSSVGRGELVWGLPLG